MTADEQRVLREVQAALAPDALRGAVLCFTQWREAYQPATLAPASREELRTELERFVGYLHEHYYASGKAAWTDFLRRRDTDDLLTRAFGSAIDGERTLWRIASESSMRAVLDVLTQQREEQALQTYLKLRVFAAIKSLPLPSQLQVATAYLDTFRTLPHLQTEHPVLLMSRWQEALIKHARIVLGWK